MLKWLILFLVFASHAMAADGDDVTYLFATPGRTDYPLTIKLCDTKTSNTDCGPVYVPQFEAYKTTLAVYRLANGASDCTYDNWNVYQLPDTNTATTYGKPALYTIDDDGVGGLTSVSAGQRLDVYGTLGPYLWIDAGTIGTCDNFTVMLQIYKKQ